MIKRGHYKLSTIGVKRNTINRRMKFEGDNNFDEETLTLTLNFSSIGNTAWFKDEDIKAAVIKHLSVIEWKK